MDALEKVLQEIDQTSTRLYQMSGKFGQDLRENEWLMSIKQRTDALAEGILVADQIGVARYQHARAPDDPAMLLSSACDDTNVRAPELPSCRGLVSSNGSKK